MRLTASDFYVYYRPSLCGLRVYLRNQGEREAPPGPYRAVLRRLGERHERVHLATFPSFADLSAGSEESRVARTKAEVDEGAAAIYQAMLKTETILEGTACEVVGIPDLLVREGEQYEIRDVKLSRRITDKDHPEILRQLELYGWLYEQTFGRPAGGLRVYSGAGEIVPVPDDGGAQALEVLREILELKQTHEEPYEPVGWTKCGDCGFHHRCWPAAEIKQDVALVAGVDQGLASALREEGVETIEGLLGQFDRGRLAEFERPWGQRKQRVGKRADAVLRSARAMMDGREISLGTPAVPDMPNYVMFDLEGIPPQLDELEKIYLWGLQVFGERPGEFRAAAAGFGVDGDRDGWETFLAEAVAIFDEYGDLPFVHWHHYERSRLGMYTDRFGDPDGVAARVKANLLDLLPITQKAVALPLPSYSLKVVERYIGFERRLEEARGDWAMAQYIEATETEDEDERRGVMEAILSYNQEDLEATWAVLNWLRKRTKDEDKTV